MVWLPPLSPQWRSFPRWRKALAKHRLGDRARQRRGVLNDADNRHDHQEMQEVVSRKYARPEHVRALRGLGSEVAQRHDRDDEEPEEPLVDGAVLGRAHARGVEPGYEDE